MNLYRLFHTVRYLKPIQIYGRLWFRLYRPKPDLWQAPAIRSIRADWVESCKKKVSLIAPYRFRFLNIEHDCKFPEDWNNLQWDKLWLYNLHYFDDLQAGDAKNKKDLHKKLIEKWIRENPPGSGNGWEPYPVSLRMVNWIKWALAGNKLSSEMMKSMAIQARWLRKRLEIHLLGNHLFANAKALVLAGLFFQEDEANQWLKKGLEILEREIDEQILPDGGHFERSPMYHAIILEDLLDLINMLHTYGHPVPKGWPVKTRAMLSWLAGMRHPDGKIVLFNDAAFGIAPAPDSLIAYAGRIGIVATREALGELTHFSDTGYIRCQKGPAVAFLDVAPIGPDYLPGHAHADSLSFELSLFGQRLIVDTGTSCYGTGQERQRQRGTAAHNTVTIDGQDSSEVWGGFRVARRAYPRDVRIEASNGEIRVSGSHDGYGRLPGKPGHKRSWFFKENALQITDRIDGPFETATGRFYVHPDLKLECMDACKGTILLPDGKNVTWKVTGGRCRVEKSTWHPEFGRSIPNQCLEVQFTRKKVVTCFRFYGF
jgi:uncharacterized heparinase superfamily protein